MATKSDKAVEVTEKAKRRQHSPAFKKRVLLEADACSKPGELGALLRREGLYSSHLAAWRRARTLGGEQGLEAKQRGPKKVEKDPRDQQFVEQERELTRWKARAERAEALVEIQKKVSALLGMDLPESGGRRS